MNYQIDDDIYVPVNELAREGLMQRIWTRLEEFVAARFRHARASHS